MKRAARSTLHAYQVDETRRRIMRSVHSKHTTPELVVRSILWNAGYRFRLHRRDLPGNPDIVFAARKKLIFVHGCFWHRHPGCSKSKFPKSRREYWVPKLKRNRQRDLRSIASLQRAKWKTLVVWQCQLTDTRSLTATLRRFLGPPRLLP